jgi:hypothetical protein
MRKKSGQLVAANPNVTGLLSRRLQAMRDGEMRMRVQHVRLGTPLIKENARRVTACMPSNYLAPLVQSEMLLKAVSLANDFVTNYFHSTALRAAVFSNKVSEITIAKPGTYLSTSHAKVLNKRVQVPDCFDVDDLQ